MSKSTISTFELFQMFPDAEAARVYMEGKMTHPMTTDSMVEKMARAAANDNDDLRITDGSGNVFRDLDLRDADEAMAALKEFHAKGGIRFSDFKAGLDAALKEGE